MSSQPTPATLSGKKIKLLMVILTVFIGLPVILFLFLAAQGLITQASNAKPEDVVAFAITKSSTTITWITTKKTQGVVEYGTSPTTLTFYGPEVEAKKEHSVPLTLLTPATTYYFQLNIDGTIYDNEGVPWTFTTKTKDGTDVVEAVKGISIKNFVEPEATKEATMGINTSNCVYTTCTEIQAHLGSGCNSSDYFKCISAPENVSGASITSIPTPTPVSIMSSSCKMKYLQVQHGKSCAEWTWEPYATKSPECKDAFSQYVFQCSSKSFTSTNAEEVATWYYNNAISNMSTNEITLNSKPDNGSTVFCQIRAEDAKGNATAWVQQSAKCNYTPTPTP